MSPTLIPVLLQMVQAGLTLEPELVAAGQQELALLGSGKPPTVEQLAQIDAALDAAHAALQGAA